MTDPHLAKVEQAIAEHRVGNLDAAEQLYRQILADDSRHFDATHLLGLLLYHRGDPQAGLRLLLAAESINPNVADLHVNLAVVLESIGRFDDSIRHGERALQLGPSEANGLQSLALTLSRLKRAESAAAAWERLARMQPNRPDVFSNLAVTLEWLGRNDQAIAACRRAIQLDPNYALAYHNFGVLLERMGRTDEAILNYRRAIQLRPDHPDPHANLANVLQLSGRIDDAIESARRAIGLNPGHIVAYRNLTGALQEQGDLDAAAKACDTACRLLEESATREPGATQTIARMRAINATLLPPVYQSVEEIGRWRSRLSENLAQLARGGVRIDLASEPAPVLFSLAYQGRDDREIQAQYARLMLAAPGSALPGSTAAGRKIRVGFISRFFRSHTIGRLNLGLIENLSRQRFDVTVFSIGTSEEDVAAAIRGAADQFVPLSTALQPARNAIAAQDLDVLLYADLGMDPITFSLAFSRLAPVQCVTWGHPVTSGIPSIDCFISSELLEDDTAQAQYTERLVRLKNLAVCYHRPTLTVSPRSRADFDLPADAHLYGCLQMLQKFHPDFDELIAGVLRRDPKGILVLVRGINRNWDDLLLKRFSRTMPDVLDRVRFVPRMSYENFLWLTSLCDVMLDPIHFGGGNTSYEAFAFGVPVVTLPSQLLRGRISMALYRMMGIADFVASDARSYIEIASALGLDAHGRQAASDKILGASDVLFENESGVRDLEAFLEQAVLRSVCPR